jgi:hypothetical protein
LARYAQSYFSPRFVAAGLGSLARTRGVAVDKKHVFVTTSTFGQPGGTVIDLGG